MFAGRNRSQKLAYQTLSGLVLFLILSFVGERGIWSQDMKAEINSSIASSQKTPGITVIPSQFNESLYTGGEIARKMVMHNSGPDLVAFEISTEYIEKGLSYFSNPPHWAVDKSRLRTDFSKSGAELGAFKSAVRPTPPESVVVIYTPQVPVQSRSLSHIAVLAPDASGGDGLADVAQYLINSGEFASVTAINGYYFTPTLEELLPYDAIAVIQYCGVV